MGFLVFALPPLPIRGGRGFSYSFSIERTVQCNGCLIWGLGWRAGLVAGLRVGQAYGVSHRPGFGLLGSVPRSLSTQPPFVTQVLIIIIIIVIIIIIIIIDLSDNDKGPRSPGISVYTAQQVLTLALNCPALPEGFKMFLVTPWSAKTVSLRIVLFTLYSSPYLVFHS